MSLRKRKRSQPISTARCQLRYKESISEGGVCQTLRRASLTNKRKSVCLKRKKAIEGSSETSKEKKSIKQARKVIQVLSKISKVKQSINKVRKQEQKGQAIKAR